jgi:uncharacterized protein DUF2163
MRSVINGKGVDVTSSVLGMLAAQQELQIATIYMIGDYEDPTTLFLTDWDSDLVWSPYGTFKRDNISRKQVDSKIGLEVTTLDVEWHPTNTAFTNDIFSTSPYQLAYMGKYDGATFLSWTAYIANAGDVDTIGASELFGGRIGDMEISNGTIKFTVNSFLDVINMNVPGAVIESTNTIAGYAGATPPTGSASVPTFSVIGGTDQAIWGSGSSFGANVFQNGFLVFTSGVLAGRFSAVQQYFFAAAGGGFPARNVFVLYDKMPWAPNVGDQFYVSAQFPLNQSDGKYFGFPFVPAPEFAGV